MAMHEAHRSRRITRSEGIGSVVKVELAPADASPGPAPSTEPASDAWLRDRRYAPEMADQVSVSEEIGAPAERVWAMVADVTRMGEWSPETKGAVWLKGATTATPGASFRGTNRNGKKQWETTATIIAADPGKTLSFKVTAVAGVKVSEWRYDFDDTESGCRVTETWIDRRNGLTKVLGKPISGVDDREEHNKAGMVETLSRLKAAAEAG